MQLISSVLDVFSTSLVFTLGALIAIKLAKPFAATKYRAILIYLWHTIFCVLYAYFVITNGGDSIEYYQPSLEMTTEYALGTGAVGIFTQFLSINLGLSFLGAFFVFNIFGYIGLLAFDSSLRLATFNKPKNIRQLGTLIIFLPSVSFWSCAIGKDAISFMAAGLALYAAIELKKNTLLMILAIFAMLLVRPHIAGLMVFALGISTLLQSRIPLLQRAVVAATAILGSIFLIPFGLTYAGLDAQNFADVAAFVEQRQGYNQEGGGGIDISQMSLPLQLFTYLFRPLPYEVNSIFSFAASIDNVILLFLFIWCGYRLINRRISNTEILPGNRIFFWVYALSVWLISALTTANLGISLRQKWMFVPMLVFLLITIISREKHKLNERGSLRNGVGLSSSRVHLRKP